MIQSSAKVGCTDFGTRSKVVIMVFLALKTFYLEPKSVLVTFITSSKVLIMVFLTFKIFNLVKKVASSFLALD